MGFFNRKKVETQQPQFSNSQESSLVEIPDENVEVMEDENLKDLKNKVEDKKPILETSESEMTEEDLKKENISFENQLEELEKRKSEILKQKQEAEEEAKKNNINDLSFNTSDNQYGYQQQIYLSESELLREMNRKLDLILFEMSNSSNDISND